MTLNPKCRVRLPGGFTTTTTGDNNSVVRHRFLLFPLPSPQSSTAAVRFTIKKRNKTRQSAARNEGKNTSLNAIYMYIEGGVYGGLGDRPFLQAIVCGQCPGINHK